MRVLSFVSLLFLAISGVAQKKSGNFNVLISKIKGDLNRDGLDDVVIVTQDTTNKTQPYKLEIYFTRSRRNQKLILTTTKAIEPRIDTNMEVPNITEFGRVEIKKGVLSIGEQYLRSYSTYKFRYQNKNFELIGYTASSSDGHGTCYDIDFNLSTGTKIETAQSCSTDKIIKTKKSKVNIRYLPKLQNFMPSMYIW